jgi:mannitol/fructose-specific phosphotransferase system IIA component (Ntr-type)
VLLSQLVTPQLVRVPIAGADKAAVIRELVGVLAQNGGGDFNDILKAVEDREAVLSTGIGYGVAVPHGKSPTAERLRMVAGSSPTPIPFGAIDGLPVQLFFLLVGPESASTDHVRALSRISRLVRREPLREQLIAARDAAEFHRVLSAAETT